VFEGEGPDPAFAPLYALIVGRVIQAFGAGAMVPVSMALVADLFPPEKRALPLGIVGAVDTVGWVLGHLYGGIMVQFMTWPYLFWINLPIIAVMFAVTWWGLAGLRRADATGGIDWIGVTLLGIALVLVNIGLGSPEIASEVSTNPPQTRVWNLSQNSRERPECAQARSEPRDSKWTYSEGRARTRQSNRVAQLVLR